MKKNAIVTTKYTLISFIPKNLFNQFRKLANCWFVGILILETIPDISNSDGVPVMAPPLCTVMGLSMIKDAWENY
jgi:hypothetical protein